ncbi:MAG TPA: acyl-CoA carboxylase epsilon subunit [Jatrophihabitans sp.]|nr:acyl-CoA carboxylase epsilon subunit [Jatrophihabitans sp.]
MSTEILVRGAATREEIAALLAALAARDGRVAPISRFEQWRRQRRKVLRENS